MGSLQMGCVVCRFFFFYYDQMKKTQRSLSLSTHPLVCFLKTGLEEKLDPAAGGNQSRTPYTAARSHGSRKCPTPLQFPLSLSLSPPPSPSLPLARFPSPRLPILTILPSIPDTRHSAASWVSPFSNVASLLWQLCCSAVVYRLHILSPAFLTPTSALHSGLSVMDLSPAYLTFCCVCLGECVGEGER